MTKLKVAGLKKTYKIPMWPTPCIVATIMMLFYQAYAWGVPFKSGLLPWWLVFLPLYIIPGIGLVFSGLVLFTVLMAMVLAVLGLAYESFVGRR